KNLKVEAVSADAGEVGTIVVSCRNFDGDEDEAVKVIAEEVIMSVDEDEDVPVMYSGTDVLETGLTSKNSHKALEVTIKESVVGAWDTVDKWTLSLPEGVYATDGTAIVENAELTWKNAATADAAFKDAYADGDFENFEFGRRSFTVAAGKKAEIKFTLELVAEPEFEGPVTLTLSGDAFEGEAEVVIAEFVRPYTVEAQQNDMIIDYKETPVPSAIVVTEAEEGLWKDTTDVTTFDFAIEGNHIVVEDAGDVTVNETSDMDVKQVSTGFYVKEESHDEAGVVTLDGILLYMERNVPAGAYDLLLTTSMSDSFMAEEVFGASVGTATIGGTAYPTEDVRFVYYDNDAEYFETVKEGFVNVITAGRDKDDASFTTKVVVPVGESYLIAGEETVALDVPAYINAAGYTMLPVRAVATALGIDTNNVLWSQAAKQVTILYGQRIITMTVGQSVIYVNGSAIPAAAAVEVVDGRAFLGLRDLANALGVTDIAYDAATKTATLN
ncbi:MAG: copper amine oxidase N-terminal domain-containing protein, partial [Anaerotignum sp.]|nr:copper amine oxidase N-terminal domain-containing protein [Anaerotignum sp.]